ncbi:F-box protein [Apostasia shenzhenica]|uniref:F-box protein n=1 Tax=Apostasia shenzhenica TaxID=1088818 RepID=A0A2I0AWF7_9ASPA|nr:F-box protein [Apostasia shenzhenica]
METEISRRPVANPQIYCNVNDLGLKLTSARDSGFLLPLCSSISVSSSPLLPADARSPSIYRCRPPQCISTGRFRYEKFPRDGVSTGNCKFFKIFSDWSYGEVLKAVFPLLKGEDLASCMLVSRQWREIARDEYFWKCFCAKRWPSICERPPPNLSYRLLYQTFSKPQTPQPLLPPKLSFEVLEFYIDLWAEQTLIFSAAISGLNLRSGVKNRPQGIPEVLKAHLDGPDYKMTVEVEPSFTVPLGQNVTVSVLVSRCDTNKIACILNRALFDYIDRNSFRALAYDYLNFSPAHPFISGIRAWVSLLFLEVNNDNIIDIFGIEIDFCDAASSENEVLWLLDMLDWK